MECPICGTEIELEHYAVCNTCYPVYICYGDEEQKKLWYALRTIVNTELTYQELEVLADSPGFIRVMIDVICIMAKDKLTRFLNKIMEKINA